jgi:prepilin-type N-terminal cleavage/methylation domain-containing protein
MASRTKGRPNGVQSDGCRGFSLIEVLVALAIASTLAVTITRFASNTRANAGRIRELATMMSLSTYLLEQTITQPPTVGEGRTAGFVWHMRKDRLAYTAIEKKLLPKDASSGSNSGPAQANPANGGSATMTGPAPATSQSLASAGTPSGLQQQASPPVQKQYWTPVRVTVQIEAPSGRRFSADTIRLENAADEQAPTKDN